MTERSNKAARDAEIRRHLFVDADQTDQCQIRQVVSLRQHLRADKNARLIRREANG